MKKLVSETVTAREIRLWLSSLGDDDLVFVEQLGDNVGLTHDVALNTHWLPERMGNSTVTTSLAFGTLSTPHIQAKRAVQQRRSKHEN